MKRSELWSGMFRTVIAPIFLMLAICLPTIWMTKVVTWIYIVTVDAGLAWLVWKVAVKNEPPRFLKRLGF